MFRMLVGSEDKCRYMVECLGVTGDAGGVDVLVFFTFTLLAHPNPHPFFPHRSMLLFLASIVSFVRLTGSGNDPSLRAPLSATARVAVTGVLVLGLVYLAMIVRTLTRYGRRREVRADVEMILGMSMGAVSVQVREKKERDRGWDVGGIRRRVGGADRHVEEP